MNLLEFKRKLMTEPGEASSEMRAARAKEGEFAEAAAESDRFEALVADAFKVKPPEGLAEQVILHQAMQPKADRWRRPRLFAIAAAVTLGVALTSFNLIQQESPQHFAEHLAWHWELHGEERMQMASGVSQADATQARRVFSSLGLEVSEELMGSMRWVKFCPDMEGEGAHIIMNSDQGPITMYYMPNTKLVDGEQRVELPDGMQAFAVNVERGSLALIAAPGIDKPALAREIAGQMSFPPGVTL